MLSCEFKKIVHKGHHTVVAMRLCAEAAYDLFPSPPPFTPRFYLNVKQSSPINMQKIRALQFHNVWAFMLVTSSTKLLPHIKYSTASHEHTSEKASGKPGINYAIVLFSRQ